MENTAIVQNICITAGLLVAAGALTLLKGALKQLSEKLSRV